VEKVGIIKEKLAAFRRKYYLNRVIRGGVIFLLLFSTLFALFTLSEGLLWLSTTWRTVLFATLTGASALALGAGVIYPGLKYLNVGPTISDHEAARLIGRHFKEVDDRLLNLLELSAGAGENASADLLAAAIDERIEAMRPVPFTAAVSFQPNRKLARYLAIPALLLLLMFLFYPDVVTKGSYRLVNFNRHFQPPPPFTVSIPDHKDALVEGQSHTIRILLSGDRLPAELYMYTQSDGGGYLKHSLVKKNNAEYEYTFKTVRKSFRYYVGNDLHGTGEYAVEVYGRPAIGNFTVTITPPAYTGLPAETLAPNAGDFTAPYGSTAVWNFAFKGNVQSAVFKSGSPIPIPVRGANAVFSKIITENTDYLVALKSDKGVENADTVRYSIKVVADKYPSAQIQSPAYDAKLPVSGVIGLVTDLSDDYGFTKAELVWKFTKSQNPSRILGQETVLPLDGIKPGNYLTLENKIDFIRLGAESGDEIEYYVRVWDNDYLTGPKSAVSAAQKINYESLESLYENVQETNENIEQSMEANLKNADELAKKFDEVQKKLLEKKNLSYEDRKEIEKMIEEQKKMMKQMEQSAQDLREQIETAKENNLFTEETIEKLAQLEKLMQELSTPEMRRFMEELQNKIQQLDSRDIKQQLEQLEKNADKFKEDLERTLELFKQMKVDMKVQELLQKVENLEQRQDLLKDRTENANKEELAELKKKQDELSKEMDAVKKDLQELKDLKNETQTPDIDKMDGLQQDADDAQQQMNQAGENMKQNNKKQAQQNQKNAKDKLRKMKQELNDMQAANEMQQMAENLDDLRALLENLVKLSFDQEDLRDRMTVANVKDAAMNKAIQQQAKLRDDMQMIGDSLRALAQRSFEIQSFVMDELRNIEQSFERANEQLNEKKISFATREQTQIMTGLNNLANMLVDAMEQMQQQMKQMQQQQGQGQACKMPKQGQSMQQLSKMQQQLNQQMMQMLQSGKIDQGKLEQMAAQQEAIRKKLQEAFEKMKQEGEKGLGSGDKIADDMKLTEEQLKNKELTQEMMMRQQQILNRMLDFDKAMREREYENKRRSNTGKDVVRNSPAELSAEEMQRKIRKESYNKARYRYTPAYQNLIDQYYKLLDEK
jgi:hypothetical protein